jgi:hypothetical protein
MLSPFFCSRLGNIFVPLNPELVSSRLEITHFQPTLLQLWFAIQLCHTQAQLILLIVTRVLMEFLWPKISIQTPVTELHAA